MLRGHPTPFKRVLVEPKEHRFNFYRQEGTLTATYSVSHFSRRTVTKGDVTDLCMLRLCKIRRHCRSVHVATW